MDTGIVTQPRGRFPLLAANLLHRGNMLSLTRSIVIIASGSLITTATLGCADERLTSPRNEARLVQNPLVGFGAMPAALKSQDDDLVRLNDEVPGFGGLFWVEGTPQVYLTAGADRDRAVRGVAAYLKRQGNPPEWQSLAARIQVREGQYEFRHLSGWLRKFMQQADVGGVTLTDVDDRTNRFHIGVIDAATLARVRAQLQELDIPEGAVTFEIMDPPTTGATLQDTFHPRIAGLQINRTNSTTSGACTLSFLAFAGNYSWVDSSTMYFVTNSHCTNNHFATDLGWMGQAYLANPIGYEIADPPLFTNAQDSLCPAYYYGSVVYCRYSDAALFVATYDINPAWPGTIAKPAFQSINIADHYSITNQGMSVGPGWYVRKVGRTTGETTGIITRTCANVEHRAINPPPGTVKYMLCQGELEYMNFQGGDSGAPVIVDDFWSGQGYHNPVALQGIMWGGVQHPRQYYSHLMYVNLELSSAAGFPLRIQR